MVDGVHTSPFISPYTEGSYDPLQSVRGNRSMTGRASVLGVTCEMNFILRGTCTGMPLPPPPMAFRKMVLVVDGGGWCR